MAGVLQHLRSSTLDKRPNPASMVDGQVAINYASGSPGMFFKDSNGDLVKVGPVHVGTTAPNVSPASGGTAGNSKGEQWLDTTGGTYVFKVWDGSAWRSETGTFVDVNGDTMTGALGIIAGSASTPGLFFSGDANTGVYSPGADQLALSTGGTGRLFVDASGRVGVNTTSPNYALDVKTTGTTISSSFTSDQSEQYIALKDSGTTLGHVRLGSTSGAMLFNAGNAERMRIDTSGRLGVGTSNVTRNLVVQSASQSDILIRSGNTNYAQLLFGDTDAEYRGAISYDHQTDKLNLVSAGSTAVTIDSSGRLGIGTSSPSFLLDAFKPSAGTVARFQANGTDSNISIKNSTREGVIGSDNTQSYLLNTDAFPWSFWTNNTERLRITADGKLGIGTSSPAVPLHVSGDGNSLRLQRSTYSGTGETVSLDFRHFASNLSADYAGATITSVTTDSFTAGGGAGLFDAALTFSTLNDAVSAERMRISSSGNVGIGTTSPSVPLHLSSGIAGNEVARFTNAGGFGLRIIPQVDGSTTAIRVAGGESLRFDTNSTEAVRIDTSGRLLVGTSTSLRGSKLEVLSTGNDHQSLIGGNQIAQFELCRSSNSAGGAGVVASGDVIARIECLGNDGSAYRSAARIEAAVDGTPGTNDMPGRLVFSTTADGASSPTERMRITNSGFQRIYSSAAVAHVSQSSSGAGTTNSLYYGSYGATDNQGTSAVNSYVVWSNGNVQNTNNSYTGISDIKLKENIVDASSQWDDIKALQVRNYNLKEGQTHRQIGLIAQEVEPISPGLVYESPDRDAEGNDLGTVTKSVNYSVLYMKAVKALQEAMERIETLEAKVAALESA